MREKTAEIKRLDVRFVSMLCPRSYSCLEPRYLCGGGGGRGEGGVGRGDENFTLWCCSLEMFPSVMMVRPLPDSDLFSS